MNSAAEKNVFALRHVGLDPALADRIRTVRIGVWTDANSNKISGRLIGELLGDLLGRLWLRVDIAGPLADPIGSAASAAAASAGVNLALESRWDPPYDYVISIGTHSPTGSETGFQIGAANWTVSAGPEATVADDPNPFGPAIAACVAAAEAFKTVFSDELGDKRRPVPDGFNWSPFPKGAALGPLDMPDAAIFGAGAVTHGLVWLLARWPNLVTGQLHVVDPDHFDAGNGQRYVGMRVDDLILPKANRLADRLRSAHQGLRVQPFVTDMNTYYETERRDARLALAIAGMDSIEHRRQLAAKLPRRAINMWTEAERSGAATHGIRDGWPCLCCPYPFDVSSVPDELGEIYAETGLKPVRIRQLLQTTAPLTADDVAVISQRLGTNLDSLVGRPLRSARAELCAIGRIQLSSTVRSVDVPFAFVSAMAGALGFAELYRETTKEVRPAGRWQVSGLRYPSPTSWWHAQPRSDCSICSDPLVDEVMRHKYA